MFLNQPVEPANSLTEQAQQTAEEALQATQKVAHEALKKLTDALQELQLQTLPLAERAGAQASALAHRGMDSVRDTTHHLRQKVEHVSENTVAYIKHDPVKSVLIAAATGAALMALISLVSHARHHN